MLAKYTNPFKTVYLWGSQEALDLRALLEAISQIEALEEKRRKMMKQVNMSEETLQQMMPRNEELIEDDKEVPGAVVREQPVVQEAAEQPSPAIQTQKDIVHYTEIREHMVHYMASEWIPKFKTEKARQYRLIMREYARAEMMNASRQRSMWDNITSHYKKANS